MDTVGAGILGASLGNSIGILDAAVGMKGLGTKEPTAEFTGGSFSQMRHIVPM